MGPSRTHHITAAADASEQRRGNTSQRQQRRESAGALIVAQSMWDALCAEVRADQQRETAAFMLARPVRTPAGQWRLVAFEMVRVPDEAYLERSASHVVLPPSVTAAVTARARDANAVVVLAHSHVGGALPLPSSRDHAGEQALVPCIVRRTNQPVVRLIVGVHSQHVALVQFEVRDGLADHSPAALTETPLDVILVGSAVQRLTTVREDDAAGAVAQTTHTDDRYDRQVRAFGRDGQVALEQQRIAVIGLGGTGSHVVQQLAHLGIQHFVLIDPDRLERTNLNRVVGATPQDVGRFKVDVAADLIVRVQPTASVVPLATDVTEQTVGRRLLDCDAFVCCTDNHGSRAVLNQLSHQYLLPGIDLGVEIGASGSPLGEGGADAQAARDMLISGRVQLLAPDHACLVCRAGTLDPEQVRRDLLTPEARAADPYIRHHAEPQPAVISLNGQVASLAVTMLLAMFCGIPLGGRHIRLRMQRAASSPIETTPEANCPICSLRGFARRADSAPFPGRTTPRPVIGAR